MSKRQEMAVAASSLMTTTYVLLGLYVSTTPELTSPTSSTSLQVSPRNRQTCLRRTILNVPCLTPLPSRAASSLCVQPAYKSPNAAIETRFFVALVARQGNAADLRRHTLTLIVAIIHMVCPRYVPHTGLPVASHLMWTAGPD